MKIAKSVANIQEFTVFQNDLVSGNLVCQNNLVSFPPIGLAHQKTSGLTASVYYFSSIESSETRIYYTHCYTQGGGVKHIELKNSKGVA